MLVRRVEFCGAYRLVGWFVGEAFPAACGQTSWWSHEVVSKIYIPLITLHSVLIPGCCSLSHSFALQSCTTWFNILDEVRKKWSFWAVCCTAGEARCSLTHFHFLPWKKSQAKKFSLNTDLCHLGGGVMWVKINCSSYLLQWVQSQIFFVQQCAATSMLYSWTSTEALLSKGNCQNLCSLGGRW